MSVLALIPARSGSKSVKHKNLQVWRGKPLLGHAVEHALAARTVDRVIVSTDSEDYAEVARLYGAEVPFIRPAEFATDTATDLDVFTHALEWLDAHEAYRPTLCVHLRPTYPSRNPELIDTLVKLLDSDASLDSVRTVVPASETPFKMWFRTGEGLLSPIIANGQAAYNLPRQCLPCVYWQNACLDVVRTSTILAQHSMTGSRIFGYVMPDDERFDIDTPDDLARLHSRNNPPVPDKGRSLTFCFDLDGVIATVVPGNDYRKASCITPTVELINKLFGSGHRILIFTARGSATGLDWREVTEAQLSAWGVRYHELRFGKPAADVYVDDKCVPEYKLHELIGER